MILLIQFLLRLSFGMAAGMAIVSSRQVASGYFRNNLYVTLGLASLAALLSRAGAPDQFRYAVLAAVASYVGAICWLYERPGLGKPMLLIVALASLTGTFAAWSTTADARMEPQILDKYFPAPAMGETITAADVEASAQRAMRIGYAAGFLGLLANVSSGLLLGLTMAAMLLGHWYLNSPTMQLLPLRRLIVALGVAAGLQAIVSSLGLWGEVASAQTLTTQWLLFVTLRWCFGLIGVGLLAWMAWQTLKIPNTQSATGILYVAVIGVFVGETMSLLLSAESVFPI